MHTAPARPRGAPRAGALTPPPPPPPPAPGPPRAPAQDQSDSQHLYAHLNSAKMTPTKMAPSDNMYAGDIQQPPVYDQASYDDYPPQGVQQQLYANNHHVAAHAHAHQGRGYDDWAGVAPGQGYN
jgi:hypothetical protein